MGKTRFCSSQLDSASLCAMRLGKPVSYELLLSAMNHKRGKHERRVVSALAPFVIDQVTSLREQGVTECILSGHAGVSKELLVTASDMSKCLMLWRLLLEYINLIILRIFYGKLCACVNSVYQAVFFGLGTTAWERG